MHEKSLIDAAPLNNNGTGTAVLFLVSGIFKNIEFVFE